MSLANYAAQAQQYQELYQQGQMTADEFKSLTNDLVYQAQVATMAQEFADDQMYRAILLGVLQVAQAAA